jgi:hypothetical protein
MEDPMSSSTQTNPPSGDLKTFSVEVVLSVVMSGPVEVEAEDAEGARDAIHQMDLQELADELDLYDVEENDRHVEGEPEEVSE